MLIEISSYIYLTLFHTQFNCKTDEFNDIFVEKVSYGNMTASALHSYFELMWICYKMITIMQLHIFHCSNTTTILTQMSSVDSVKMRKHIPFS